MPLLILLGFIAIPLIEIYVFIEVGSVIGPIPTIAITVLTALLGSWQLRAQGLATLERARQQLDQGVMPAKELFTGVCLLIGGVLLLVPGFVTDAVGALLFIPPFREWLRKIIGKRLAARSETRVFVDGEEVYRGRNRDGVIDAEFSDVTDDKPPPPNRTLPR